MLEHPLPEPRIALMNLRRLFNEQRLVVQEFPLGYPSPQLSFLVSPPPYLVGMPGFDLRAVQTTIAGAGAYEQSPIEISPSKITVGMARFKQITDTDVNPKIVNVYIYPNTMIANLALQFTILQSAGLRLNTLNVLKPDDLKSLDPSIKAQISALHALYLYLDISSIQKVFEEIEMIGSLSKYIEYLNSFMLTK